MPAIPDPSHIALVKDLSAIVENLSDAARNLSEINEEEACERCVAGVKSALYVIDTIMSMPSPPVDPGEPAQGQIADDGSYITAQRWFVDRGFPLPAGPDGVSDGVGDVEPEFIWAPNAPGPDSPEWDTASWCWRPPLA